MTIDSLYPNSPDDNCLLFLRFALRWQFHLFQWFSLLNFAEIIVEIYGVAVQEMSLQSMKISLRI